jgi:SAM-dependent methyltransferase
MHAMNRTAHWEHVYRTKAVDTVSWYQAEPTLSLAIIAEVAPSRDARIIDVGAGASRLTDALLSRGYEHLTVLDISAAALDVSRARLGDAAAPVTWLAADVLEVALAPSAYDVWHDRAVFHFLTDAADRARYVHQLRTALRAGGYAIVATFADDGPLRCSGLETCRYSAESLAAEFGEAFELVASHREEHTTPSGGVQAFTYVVLRMR